MDPDAALDEIRRIIARVDADDTDAGEDYERLVNLIDGLDAWMSRGGFPPRLWRREKADE